VINNAGAQVLTDPSQTPYDGIEDTLIGVLNNTTSTTVTGIPLSGGSNAIFDFDGDGACDPNSGTTSFSPGPPDANLADTGTSGAPCTDNSTDTTGYGGPDSYFTNINSPADTTGTVNFISPLAPGKSTWFSLEEAISGAELNVVTANASSISAVEGIAFSGTVATFFSSDTTTLATQYAATINWGDGTPTTTGTVSGASGSFKVTGTHTYAEEKDATTATITITDTSDGNTSTVQSPVTVADALLTVGTLSLTGGTEGVSPGSASFTFTDANPGATTADYTATINWGDGSPTSTGTVSGPTGGVFTVTGSHQYSEEDMYTVTVNVADDGGSTTSATGTVTVADASLTATGSPSFVSTNPVSNTLATFTDQNLGATTADFTSVASGGNGGSTTINWGDASTSAGTVTPTGPGQFSVSGTHTYAALGPYTITITIVDDGGNTATAVTHVIVFAFPKGGGFVIGDGNSANNTAVTFWGAQWAKSNSLSGGPAPSSFKGFEDSAAPPVCGTAWTTDPGNSTPPPSGPLPSYMGVIVSSSITKSGSTISGNTPDIVVVKTNSGYAPDPGHAGTGTVVAQVC
jgi:hypothetical protein